MYSLAYLLSRQPKSLQKQDLYAPMLRQYSTSTRLQQLRFNRRCYSLLHNARVAPHNLPHFYRTYRLPADPFFPLFLATKRAYLDHREELKHRRDRYILETLRALPPPILATIKYLGYLECHYNSRADSPVWQRYLFPGSRKAADEYRRYDQATWLLLFRRHLRRLCARYRTLSDTTADRVIACFLLGLTPPSIPPQNPSPREITSGYRRLSLLHHPDRGGDPALFIEIKRARDTLMGAG
jgi:hypothetical protein